MAVPLLLVETDKNAMPVAFMGIDDGKLEMLFIAPEERGRGLGRKLLGYGMTKYGIKELVVNEQNPQAKGFYEHMGFKFVKGQRWMNREIRILSCLWK